MSFTLTMVGHSYLYSRNPWCAIFAVNPGQTLKQQANGSVDLIWYQLRTPPVSVYSFSFFPPFLLTLSPFLPTAPCGPLIPRLPCRRQISSLYLVTHIKIPCSNSERYFFLFCSIYHCVQFDSNGRLKRKKERDYVLCLQYLLPLQVVPEAPPHPVIDGVRLRIGYNGS